MYVYACVYFNREIREIRINGTNFNEMALYQSLQKKRSNIFLLIKKIGKEKRKVMSKKEEKRNKERDERKRERTGTGKVTDAD